MNFTLRRTTLPVILALSAVLGGAAVPAVRAADLQVGQIAPDFTLPDQNGTPHHLADYRGKSVILAFYVKDSTAG